MSASYTAPEFEAPTYLQIFGAAPRFGHTSDISLLITGTESKDYILGILFVPILVLGISFLLLAIILLLKCLGEKVGWWSGNVFESKVEGRAYGTTGGAPVGVRVISLLASIGMIICASIFCSKGVDGFYDAFELIRDGVEDINDVGADITNVADNLVAAGNQAAVLRDQLQEIVNEGGICSILGEFVNTQIDTELESVISALDMLNDFTDTSIPTSDEPFPIIDMIQTADSKIDLVLDIAEEHTWKARFFVIPMAICTLWILIGGVYAWFIPQFGFKGYFCLQSWFAIPLAVICVIVSSILLGICGAALVMNSDLCTPPEETVNDIIDGYTTLETKNMEYLDYYVFNGCEGSLSELVELENTIEEYQDVKNQLAEVRSTFKSEQAQYERFCLGCVVSIIDCPGAEGSLDDVGIALDDLYDLATKLDVSAERILDVTSCERINGIYVDLIHNGVCTVLPGAFYLVFVTLSLLSMFGLGMLITRAGTFPSKEGNYLEMKPTASGDEFDERMSDENYSSQY